MMQESTREMIMNINKILLSGLKRDTFHLLHQVTTLPPILHTETTGNGCSCLNVAVEKSFHLQWPSIQR